MRIGVLCYPSIGGSGLVATELGRDLAKRGHEVHFISYSVPFKLPAFDRNIHFHSVDPINYPLFNQTLYTFSLTAKIVEVATEYKLDLVHAHYSIPHSLCAHLAREICDGDFRIVTTLHGTDVTIVGQDKPLFSLNRYGIEKSDLVTTVSAFQRQHTIKYFGIQQSIEVIYNFIDLDTFKPDCGADRSAFAAPDERIIMHISNFRPLKNPQAAMRAFHLVQQQLPARLVLVGDGPEITELKQLCQALGICDKVCYLGKVDQVETVLPLADCVLQPSYRESFGMVLLEAMACEVPTVSSNVDGIPEVVAADETGFTADPDDIAGLAAGVLAAVADPARQRQLGQNGRRRARQLFDKDVIIPKYLDAYERVLAR